ncbi:MAG: hypothetical protein ACQETX_14895 [Pseudomonadota bacterium]
MPIVLHVGMPKCGSSAIQNYLSSRVFHEASKASVVYLAVKRDGVVVFGERLVREAANSPFGYASSHNAEIINSISKSKSKRVIDLINDFLSQGFLVIISNEGWGPKPDAFSDSHEIFSNLKEKVEVVGYVRPQVEWINSAWWQWGAWSDVKFDRWVSANKKTSQWGKAFESWSKKPWVKKATPRLMDADVVSDFVGYLGLPEVSAGHSNKSLPGSLLRFFQGHRELRRGPHSSAIEFVLSGVIDFPDNKTPWVVPKWQVEDVLSSCRDDNLLLESYLSQSGLSILDNDKWWAFSPYRDKNVEPPGPVKPSYDDLDELLFSALASIGAGKGK